MWKLASKDPNYLQAIENLTENQIDLIPEKKGNKKASFIPMMNEEEKKEYIKNQQPFWKKINQKLNEIMK